MKSLLGKLIFIAMFSFIIVIFISDALKLPWLDEAFKQTNRVIETHTPAPIKKKFLPKHADIAAELKAAGFSIGQPAYIRIFKKEAQLELWMKNGKKFKKFKTYKICNFSGNLGPKLKEGDKQAPEGFYQVNAKQLNPNSRNHLAFNIGFPNAYDRSYKRTGSALMVHGGCTSIGCYAMRDAQIEEIYFIVEESLRNRGSSVAVQIFPFRMNDKNIAAHKNSPWAGFWQNLKQGYDMFERDKTPPTPYVCDGKYVFSKGESCQAIAGW